MKFRLKKALLILHFVSLAIAIFNSLFKAFLTFSLLSHLELTIELSVVVSGLTLFFFYLKPYKKLSYYLSIYPFAVLLVTIGILFRGIFMGLIVSIVLFPIVPNQKVYEYNDLIIAIPFQGFIGRCCEYQISERKLLIFERKLGVFETEGPIDFDTLKMVQNENVVEFAYLVNGELKKINIEK